MSLKWTSPWHSSISVTGTPAVKQIQCHLTEWSMAQVREYFGQGTACTLKRCQGHLFGKIMTLTTKEHFSGTFRFRSIYNQPQYIWTISKGECQNKCAAKSFSKSIWIFLPFKTTSSECKIIIFVFYDCIIKLNSEWNQVKWKKSVRVVGIFMHSPLNSKTNNWH